MIRLSGKEFRLPHEVSDAKYPTPEEFISETERVVKELSNNSVVARVMGAMGVYIKTRITSKDLFVKLDRLGGGKSFTDIDLASYSRYCNNIPPLMERLGYQCFKRMLIISAATRQFFYSDRIPLVEVFYDRLAMNHVINFRDRLEKACLTLPSAELLLQKLQPVHINEKDIKDTILLLKAEDLGENDSKINMKVVRSVLSDDWGFYHTFKTNLQNVGNYLESIDPRTVSEEDKLIIRNKLSIIEKEIESEPKSFGWKVRAKVGTKKKWYNEVDEWSESIKVG